MNVNCRPLIRKKNTGRVERLLILEMPIGVSFQDGETGLLGGGDGQNAGKFRCADALRELTLHGLAASPARLQRRFRRGCVVLESIATKFAGHFGRRVKVQRHGIRMSRRWSEGSSEKPSAGKVDENGVREGGGQAPPEINEERVRRANARERRVTALLAAPTFPVRW